MLTALPLTAIPVYFNVLHNGKEGKVSLSTIHKTMAYANEVYNATLGITFDLARVTYKHHPNW